MSDSSWTHNNTVGGDIVLGPLSVHISLPTVYRMYCSEVNSELEFAKGPNI
jgi:hypothetical protein